MYDYERPSWTGLSYKQEAYFPTWVIPEDHKVTKALEEAYIGLYGDKRIAPPIIKEEEKESRKTTYRQMDFSTNGVAIMGRHGIPVIGFGPGAEDQAHAPNEVTFKQDLVTCAADLCKGFLLFIQNNC